MFSILKLFYIQALFTSLNANCVEDQILTKFITAFDDDMTIENWMKSRNISRLCNLSLFKEIIREVSDILTVINTETYIDIKSLLMNTDMNLFDVSYPYFETFNIIDLVKRILRIYERPNRFLYKLKKYTNFKSFDKFLFKEYDYLYYNLEMTIIYVGFKCNPTEKPLSFTNWRKKRLRPAVQFNESSNVKENFLDVLEILEMARNILNFIIPADYETPVYVEANCKGFKTIRICFENEIHFYIREKSYIMFVCPSYILQYLIGCSGEQLKLNRIDLKEYMGKTFLCNKTTAKILITLFHYYSEIKRVNTSYELIRKKDNEYQIKWSLFTNITTEAIKNYWLKQEILDLSTKKRIHKFGLIVEYDVEYSTEKSENIERESIETRLILLSCGHQLGFELINEFFRNFYIKYDEPLMCYICRYPISIVGSYNAVVFKCN